MTAEPDSNAPGFAHPPTDGSERWTAGRGRCRTVEDRLGSSGWLSRGCRRAGGPQLMRRVDLAVDLFWPAIECNLIVRCREHIRCELPGLLLPHTMADASRGYGHPRAAVHRRLVLVDSGTTRPITDLPAALLCRSVRRTGRDRVAGSGAAQYRSGTDCCAALPAADGTSNTH
jgi:hypothetical protein